MKHYIDLAQWNRREHFAFFSQFDDPLWGITTLIDCTRVYELSHQTGSSFFLRSLHWLMQAVNATEPFKLRIEGDRVACYDQIDVSPTIARPDGTFAFAYFDYSPDYPTFERKARAEIELVKHSEGLFGNGVSQKDGLIYYSVLPWFTFTDLKHATSYGANTDSVPRLTTGKVTRDGERYVMPLSICVSHALADGRDVALLLDNLERATQELEK